MTRIKEIGKSTLQFFRISPTWVRTLVYGLDYTFDEPTIVARYFQQNGFVGKMFDVGVAMGDVSQMFLDSGWKVIGFEPDLSTTKLAALDRLATYENFTADTRAVSNKTGEQLTFYRSEISEGISSVHSFHSSHLPSHKVDTVTLKDAVQQHNAHNVSFIKIDTEGHDLNVLSGMQGSKIQPKIILCEFDEVKAKSTKSSLESIIALLESLEYFCFVCEWFPVRRYGARHKFKRIFMSPAVLDDRNSWGNVIAITMEEKDNFLDFLKGQPERRFLASLK